MTVRETASHLPILGAAAELPAEELLALHRGVSRLATRIRMADPVYQARQRLGLEVSRSSGRLGAHIAARTTGGQ